MELCQPSHLIGILSTSTVLYYYCTNFLIYDDACHLKRYACNPVRKDVTATSKFISGTKIVMDKINYIFVDTLTIGVTPTVTHTLLTT